MMQFFEISMILFACGWKVSSFRPEQYIRSAKASLINKNSELKNIAMPEIKFKF